MYYRKSTRSLKPTKRIRAVFSHPSKIDFVAQAKTLGYEIILVFIHLDSVELNQARMSQRVTVGGHNVPVDKVKKQNSKITQNHQVHILAHHEH